MEFIEIFILFLIGAISGYVIELIYRNITKSKKINPGFLKGPYLPVWGIGILLFFIITNLEISIKYKLILIIISPTIIELISGLIFKEYFKIKLWDYTKNFLNYRGIICLQFSIYWAVLAILYYIKIHTYLESTILKIFSNNSYIFFYGIIAGIFMIDIFYSFNIAFKIRKLRNRLRKRDISFREFKNTSDIFGYLKEKIEKALKKN